MNLLLLVLLSLFTNAATTEPPERAEHQRLCRALLEPHLTFAKILPSLSDEQTLTIAKGLYLEVSTWLQQEMNETARRPRSEARGDYGPDHDQTPSQFMFGIDAVEINRTAVALLSLKWMLAGDYDRFVHNQPDHAQPLTRRSFEVMSSHVRETLSTPESVDAMIVMILTNDLGKVRRYQEMIEQTMNRRITDHDEVLFEAMKAWSETSPSFHRLAPKFKALVLTGLRFGSKLNVGQLALGESLPANLAEARGFADDPEAFEFKMIEMILDIAGARGHEDASGSLTFVEPVYRTICTVRNALQNVMKGKSPRDAYDQILNLHNHALGMIALEEAADKKFARAVTRLELMAHATGFNEASDVALAFFELPETARAILISELNVDGVDDGWGILPYYAPALISNALENGSDARQSLRFVFLALARAFQEARIYLSATAHERPPNGVFTLDVGILARAVRPRGAEVSAFAVHPKSLLDHEYALRFRDGAKNLAILTWGDAHRIDPSKFPKRDHLRAAAKGVVLVGVGGGSDVIQAAQLGHFYEHTFKNVRGLISFRTSRSGSETGSARTGRERNFDKLERLGENLFRVPEELTPADVVGSGRVLEPIVSGSFPTLIARLTEDEGGDVGLAGDALAWIREHGGEFDEIVLVDTGGDSLYRVTASAASAALATPDQDLRVLRAFRGVEKKFGGAGVAFTSAVVGAGIDTPADAEEILFAADARYWNPPPDETVRILERYALWNLTGESETLFGKTPYAWQAALKGETGVTVVPLPERVVIDRVNPWNPFARVPVRGVFFMKLADHLRSIGD